MTQEEVRFFNLARAYAEPTRGYVLISLRFEEPARAYRLRFRRPEAPEHVTRDVLVFQDNFSEVVHQHKLNTAVRQEIDEALAD